MTDVWQWVDDFAEDDSFLTASLDTSGKLVCIGYEVLTYTQAPLYFHPDKARSIAQQLLLLADAAEGKAPTAPLFEGA